ncbi:MAG: phage terminase small subunit [Robiginitomaculum sp.]|nr:phage terminase small subunit [Robiginitomaculum sp.]
MNLFREHRERELAKQAAKAAATSGDGTMDTAKAANIYDQMLSQMAAHKVALKAIQSIKAKADKKAEFIPVYEAYVEGVLAADEDVQDDVVVTIFVWAIDAGQFELALRIAEWALKYDLAAPPEFSRTIATILVEELAGVVLSGRDDIANIAEYLTEVLALVCEKDMPDQVKAKFYKALGIVHTANAPQAALEYMQQALELNPRAGVKKQIAKLEKQIKDLSPAPVPATDAKTKGDKPKVSKPDGGAAGKKTGSDEPPKEPVKQAATDEQQ